MAVKSYIKSSVTGKKIFIGDYLTQRRGLEDLLREGQAHINTEYGKSCVKMAELCLYKLELNNDLDESFQRLGIVHAWNCDGSPIRCKYCAIHFPGQNPWR